MDDIEVFEQAPEMFKIGCGFHEIDTNGMGLAVDKSPNRIQWSPGYIWNENRWWYQGGKVFKTREEAEVYLAANRGVLISAPLPD